MRQNRPAFVSTAAVLEVCRRCAEPILTAIADGVGVQVDPYAVTPAGELRARLLGRMSFDAYVDHRKLLLHCRYPENIRAAGGRPVLVTHQCLHPPDGIDEQKTKQLISHFISTSEESAPEEPPF